MFCNLFNNILFIIYFLFIILLLNTNKSLLYVQACTEEFTLRCKFFSTCVKNITKYHPKLQYTYTGL